MDDFAIFLIFCFGFGIFGFFWGFTRFKKMRLIENIPTSTVRSLAIGLTELIGKASIKTPLKSPMTKTPCVYFKYKVERYEKRGKSSSWVTVAKGNSHHCPFWLDDGTGRIMVFPQYAEMMLPTDFSITTGWGKAIPNNIEEFLQSNLIRHKTFFGNYRMRFTEWYICEGEEIYVLGTAKQTAQTNNNDYNKLIARLKEIKTNPQEMSKLDLNKDGHVDPEEWSRAVKKIEQEALEESLKNQPTHEELNVIITRGETEKIYIISDHSQKGLTESLKWQSILGVFGGAILSIITGCSFISMYLK